MTTQTKEFVRDNINFYQSASQSEKQGKINFLLLQLSQYKDIYTKDFIQGAKIFLRIHKKL